MNINLNLGLTQDIISYAKHRNVLRNELAYILATAYWETGRSMQPVREAYYLQDRYGWSDARFEKWRKANLRYYPWDGRGLVQLTWKFNYRKASEILGGDFISNPDLALDPSYSVQILVIGMQQGWFTGKKLSDYITLSKSNFVGARRIVNGTDKALTIANIAKKYDVALRVAGYGIDTNNTTTAPKVEVNTPNIWKLLLEFILNLLKGK